MLKKFDIIAYKSDSDESKLKLGVVRAKNKKKDPKITVAELGQVAEADPSKWAIQVDSVEISKVDIVLKLTQVTLKGKNSKFNKFEADLSKVDVARLLDAKSYIEDEKEDMAETEMLTKRKRRRGPLKFEDCFEKLDFSEFAGKKEEMEEKKQEEDPALKAKREKDRRMLGSFMRNNTTNLRFELPDIASETKLSDSPFMFRNSQFKTDKQTVLKSLSQDLSLVFNDNQPKRLKFIEVCQTVLSELDGKYGQQIGVPMDKGLLKKEFVHVPSKAEMRQTIQYMSSVIGHLEENLQGDIEGFFYLIICQILNFSLRFFMSHETNKLHLLKNKMYLSTYEEDEQTSSAKLTALIHSLKKFIKTLKNLLSDEFYNDYLDLISSICCTIGFKSEGVIDQTEELEKKEKILTKRYMADLVFAFIKELMLCEHAEAQIIDILKCILHSVNFSNRFVLKGKQTILGKRLNTYYHDRMNHSNRKWNLYVDSCCQYIRENKMPDVIEISKDNDQIEALTHRMLSIQTSVAKGLYLAALRVALDEQVKRSKNSETLGDQMNMFLDSLLESSDKLPIFVYFVQSMSRIHGDIESFAKKKNIKPLDNFIQKYMFESGSDQANNIKFAYKDFKAVIESKNRLFFLLDNDKSDDLLNFFKEALPPLEESEEDQALPIKSKITQRYVVWLSILNEMFTTYVIAEGFEPRDKLLEKWTELKPTLLQTHSKVHIEFMDQLLNNFPKAEILSLSPSLSEGELQIRMLLLNLMINLLLTPHEFMKISTAEQSFVQRGQLAAMPGKAEEKYLLIANTFYSVDSNWRSGQQFTKLYKCSCGYLYWIGDCGRAWVRGTCPSCKKVIGGESHNLASADNKEITKEVFFKEMYGPLEEISAKIYKVRDLGGKYQGEGAMDEEKEEMVEKAPKEEMTEKGEDKGKMDEEPQPTAEAAPAETAQAVETEPATAEKKMEEETPEEKPRRKEYLPVRSMDKENHFLLVDIISHTRYFIELLVGSPEHIKELESFLSVKTEDYAQYFFDLIVHNYNLIKELEFADKPIEQFFRGMNLILSEMIPEKLMEQPTTDRNETEKLIRNVYDLIKPNFVDKVLERVEMKKDFEGNLSNSSRLVKNWVNRMASISDFKEKNSDIKVISGMRMGKNIDINHLKEYLNSRLQATVEAEETDEAAQTERGKIQFLIDVIGMEPILLIFNKMLYSHIDFCNYLQFVFDFRLTYKMACSISIEDLTQESPIVDDETEEDKEFVKKRREIIERTRGDIHLLTKFNNLNAAWQDIMKYREEFGDLFDFRFLCHATEMPKEKIEEILSPRSAKLIYFLPHEKYVESLFMTSALQTLGKIQNDFIEKSAKQYFRANYTNAKTICVQDAGKREIMGMSTTFENVIKKCSYANLTFNKDGELVYNIDMMEREIAIDLFFGCQQVSFENEFIKNFNFSREFSSVANNVTMVSQKFGQTYLEPELVSHLTSACSQDVEETYAIFSRKLKEFSEKAFNLTIIRDFQDEKDEFVINFESNYNKGDKEIEVDTSEKEIVDWLNQAKISLNTIKFSYEFIEQKMFKLGLKNLDPIFDVKLEDEKLAVVEQLVKGLEKEKLELLEKVMKAVVLRQLVGNTLEKIGQTDLRMGLEYSAVLGAEEEIDEGFLDGLPEGLKFCHLASIVGKCFE